MCLTPGSLNGIHLSIRGSLRCPLRYRDREMLCFPELHNEFFSDTSNDSNANWITFMKI